MGRPTVSTPSKHRQNVPRYNAAVNATMRSSKPGEDFGVDNFTYDPKKVGKWQMSEHIIAENLPADLYDASKDWILAGAAIDTALERIQDLNEEAAQRAFPTYTHGHLIASRRDSEQGSSVGGASDFWPIMSHTSSPTSTPATSFSQPQPPKLNIATASTTSAKKHTPHPNQLPDSITSKIGMESPPFTPVTRSGSESGSGARSPAILPNGHRDDAANSTPDFKKLSTQLSPLMSPSLCSFGSDASPANVDTVAWTNYISAYEAELDDVKKIALPRLRGAKSGVQKVVFELRAHPPENLSWAIAEAAFAFAEWWKSAKAIGREREEVIALLVVPRVEDVTGGAC